eukprot:664803-Prymnesium_polylepis.1
MMRAPGSTSSRLLLEPSASNSSRAPSRGACVSISDATQYTGTVVAAASARSRAANASAGGAGDEPGTGSSRLAMPCAERCLRWHSVTKRPPHMPSAAAAIFTSERARKGKPRAPPTPCPKKPTRRGSTRRPRGPNELKRRSRRFS